MPITTTCPRCASVVAGEPDPVAGTLTCAACGTRFDPRQGATAAAGPGAPDGWRPQAGDSIADLQLEREIGRGGMSAVWQARQGSLKRPVAVKILHAHLAADADLRRRFAREAEAMVQLDHPHIVPVIDRGEHRGRPYLVMGMVGARTLREELGPEGGGRRLPPARVAQLADQALQALAHAHKRGLVHRDIKPDNLLLEADGTLRVADFGIAQVARAIDGHTLTQLTGTNVVMGTVAYMAPEQGQGSRDVDHRCDLYALGVVCYEALRGHRPVGRFEDPTDGLGLSSSQAAAWNSFVLALLEREPQRRPKDAAAARALLAPLRATGDDQHASQNDPESLLGTDRFATERLMSEVHRARKHAVRAWQQAKGAGGKPPPVPQPPPAGQTTGQAAERSAMPIDVPYPHGSRLMRPQRERWISGVCGGFGLWLGINPDWLRLLLVICAITGPGVLMCGAGYVVAIVVMPRCPDARYRPRPLNHNWPQRRDGWFLGVCALLGEKTVIPTAVWRLLVFLTLLVGSWIPYLALGILLPSRKGAAGLEPGVHLSVSIEMDRTAATNEPSAAATAEAALPVRGGGLFRFWGMVALTTAVAALSLPQIRGFALTADPSPEVLWWITGGAGLAALVAGNSDNTRSRAGSLGGMLVGMGCIALLLSVAHAQGAVLVGGPLLAVILGTGGTLLLALASGRYAAVLLGSALIAGIGGSALLATVSWPPVPDGLDWFMHPERLIPISAVLITAAVSALLTPLFTTDTKGFQWAPTVVGLGALGSLGILLVPLSDHSSELARLHLPTVPLAMVVIIGGLIIAAGSHWAMRLLLGLAMIAGLVLLFAA